MIIGATRIRSSSGHKGVFAHVTTLAGNEEVLVARGSEADLAFAVRVAKSVGATYCLRHYHIDPAGSCSAAELAQIILDLSQEFGFDPLAALARPGARGRSGHIARPGLELDAASPRACRAPGGD
jgi:hypothetical protein